MYTYLVRDIGCILQYCKITNKAKETYNKRHFDLLIDQINYKMVIPRFQILAGLRSKLSDHADRALPFASLASLKNQHPSRRSFRHFVNMIVRAARKASRLAWFTTEVGRKFSLGCMVTAGGGAVAFNLLPHTLLLDQYRELSQMYRKSTLVRVSSNIKKQFNAALDDLKVPPETRARLKLFIVNGFDVFHAGTTHLVSGALVGVPMSFDYQDFKNIDQSTLLVQGRHVDWNKPDGQNLLSAIMLSEDARKFAIGREIIRCQTIEPLLNSVYPLSCTIMAYVIGHKCNTVLNGPARPLLFRIILYTLTGLFTLGNWAFLKDVTTVHYDMECDKELSKLGKDYIKGGQEFYTKILQRNVALRNLMGKEGAKLYSASGNEQFFVRHKRMPIVHRKLYFDQQMESLD